MTGSEERNNYLWFDSRWTRTDSKSRYEAAFWVFSASYAVLLLSLGWGLLLSLGGMARGSTSGPSPLAEFLFVTSLNVALMSQVWYLILMPLVGKLGRENCLKVGATVFVAVIITAGVLILLSFRGFSNADGPVINMFKVFISYVYAGITLGGIAYIVFLYVRKETV